MMQRKIEEWTGKAKILGAKTLIISIDPVLFMHEPRYIMDSDKVNSIIIDLSKNRYTIVEIIDIKNNTWFIF